MSTMKPDVPGETFASPPPSRSDNLITTVNTPALALRKTTKATPVSSEVPSTTPSDDITSQTSTMSQTVIIVDGPQTTFLTSTAPSNPSTTPTITAQAQPGLPNLTLTFTGADNTPHTIVAVLPDAPASTASSLAPTPEPSILLIPAWPEVKKAKLEGLPGIIFGCLFGGFVVFAAVGLYVWRRRKDRQWEARNKELIAMYGPDNWVPPENRPPRRFYVGRGEEMRWERPAEVQELMGVYGRPPGQGPVAVPQRAAQAAEKGPWNGDAAVRELPFSYTSHHVATQRYPSENPQSAFADHNSGFRFQKYQHLLPFGYSLEDAEPTMKLPHILKIGRSRGLTRTSKSPSHEHVEDATPQVPQPMAIVPFHDKRPPAKVIRDENGHFVVLLPETSSRASHAGSTNFDCPPDSGLSVSDISSIVRPFNECNFGAPGDRAQERITGSAHISEYECSSGYPFPQMGSVYDAAQPGTELLQIPTELPYIQHRSPSPLPSRYRIRAASTARHAPFHAASSTPAIAVPVSPLPPIRPTSPATRPIPIHTSTAPPLPNPRDLNPTDYPNETPLEAFHRRRGSGGWRPPPGYIPKPKPLKDADIHFDLSDDEEIFTRLRAEKKPAFKHPLTRTPDHPNLFGWKFPAPDTLEEGSYETTRSAEFMRARATTAATNDDAAERGGWWKQQHSARAHMKKHGGAETYGEFVARMAVQRMPQSTAGEWWQDDALAQWTAEMSEEEKDIEELGRVRELVAEKEAQLKDWGTLLRKGRREREDAMMRKEAAMAVKMRHDEEMKMREDAAMKAAMERKAGRLGQETTPGEFGLASPNGLVQFAGRRS